MTSNAWYNYINQLHTHIQQQDRKIKQLETRIELLEQKGQNSHQTTIEKLEYHFDQLKIERLDGTLHIGLSPDDLKKVEDMSINHSNPPTPQNLPMQQQVNSQLDAYLMNQGPGIVHQLAQEYNYPINDGYREVIINDVRKQLPHRIAHYKDIAADQQEINDDKQLFDYISEKVKQEIDHSLRLFFENEKNKGD